MKKLLALLLLCPSVGFCDGKISAMTSTTSMNTSDIIPVVVTPGTTPANRIITFQNFYNSIPSTVTAASIGALTNSSATATYLQLSSASATYLQQSSATATYLQQSSATATYLQISSATANYPKLGVGNLFTQSNTYSSSSTFNGTVIVSTSINAGGQGTSGQFLTSGGPNAVVSWTSGGAGDVIKSSTQTFTGGNTFASSTTFSGTLIANSSTSITGTTTNDDAAPGKYGEIISSSVVRSAPVAVSNGSDKTICSVQLTAGDWDVRVMLGLVAVGAVTLTEARAGISLTNNTVIGGDVASVPTGNQVTIIESATNLIASGDVFSIQIPDTRIKLTTPTNIFMVTTNAFSGGTSLSGFGSIVARRMR